MNETPSCPELRCGQTLLRSRSNAAAADRRGAPILSGSRRQSRNRCPCVINCLRRPSDCPRLVGRRPVGRARLDRVGAGSAPRRSRPATIAAAPDGTALLATIQALTAPGHGRPRHWDAGQRQGACLDSSRSSPRPGVTPVVKSSFEVPFSFTSKAGAAGAGVNLVAQCPGRRPELPVLVISAHYDHLGIRDGQTYHGADDNASGVAMLLLVAERCAATPSRRTLVLAAFDAEEQGLQGATRLRRGAADRQGADRAEHQLRHGEPQRQAGDLRRRSRAAGRRCCRC